MYAVAIILFAIVVFFVIDFLLFLLDANRPGGGHSTGSIELYAEENRSYDSDPPFQLDITVRFGFAPSFAKDDSFENVRLCLYNANGSVLYSENLGTLSGSSDTVDVSIKIKNPPKYIHVHHPRIYEYMTVHEVWVRNSGNMVFDDGTIRDLPFDPRKIDGLGCR